MLGRTTIDHHPGVGSLKLLLLNLLDVLLSRLDGLGHKNAIAPSKNQAVIIFYDAVSALALKNTEME